MADFSKYTDEELIRFLLVANQARNAAHAASVFEEAKEELEEAEKEDEEQSNALRILLENKGFLVNDIRTLDFGEMPENLREIVFQHFHGLMYGHEQEKLAALAFCEIRGELERRQHRNHAPNEDGTDEK